MFFSPIYNQYWGGAFLQCTHLKLKKNIAQKPCFFYISWGLFFLLFSSIKCKKNSDPFLIQSNSYKEENIDNGQSVLSHTDFEAVSENVVALIKLNDADKPVIFCSGVMLTSQSVLTAAHCLKNLSDFPLFVTKGNKITTHSPKFYINDFKLHPLYERGNQFDLAMIQLTDSIEIKENILPLHPEIGLTLDEKSFFSLGYGLNPSDDNSIGEKLGAGNLNILHFCKESYCPEENLVGGRFLYERNNKGPCQGDSGGPAFLKRGEQYFILGIHSTINHQECSLANRGQNTLVETHIDFIIDTLNQWKEELNFCTQKNICGNADCSPNLSQPNGLDCSHNNKQFSCEDFQSPCSFHYNCINRQEGYECDDQILDPIDSENRGLSASNGCQQQELSLLVLFILNLFAKHYKTKKWNQYL